MKDGARIAPKFTIGLVGCGLWGVNILRDLLSLGCEVVVADPSFERQQRAAAHGAVLTVRHVDELPAVNGIIVASPATTHAAVIEQALSHGAPVFTEKPFTTDRESAARLAAMAPEHLFVMHVWRYHPGIAALAEIAHTGELGPVHGLRTTRANWGSPRRDTDSIWTMAPHDLSIAIEVLGFIPAPRCAVAECLRGKPVGFVAILGDRPWLVVEGSNRHRDKRREVRLHCRDGVAVLPGGESAHVEVTRGSAPHETQAPEAEIRPVSDEPALLRELRAFLAYLDGGPSPRSSAAEALEIVSTICELRTLAGV